MIVRFHTVETFLSELRRDARRIDRNILRVALVRRYSAPITTVTLIATAAVGASAFTLEYRLGEVLFRNCELPPSLLEIGKPILERFTEFAEEVGLEVGPGVYESTGG